MKQILIILILLSGFQSYSQTNLQIGTKWVYSHRGIGGYATPSEISIVGDTIINNLTWFKLEGSSTCSFSRGNYPLIRQEGSKWKTYNLLSQNEALLYDFSLTKGESYTVTTLGSNYPIEVEIDSVKIISIDGVDLKVQYTSNPNLNSDGFIFANEIIEGIGSTGYLFPQGNICDPHTGPIRCFEANQFFIDFDMDRDCDARYFLVSTKDKFSNQFEIDIYPNPANINETINIYSDYEFEKINIYTQYGQLLKELNYPTNKSDFSLKEKGLYVIKLTTGNHRVIKRLLITN